WLPSSTLDNATISNPLATPASSTTYTVFATDLFGCTGSASVSVSVNPLPVVSASPTATVCQGSGTQLSASGGVTYVWTPALGLSNPNISNPLATPTTATTYSVTIID